MHCLVRSLSVLAVYAQRASKVQNQVMGCLRGQIQLRLEDASLHREARQQMPREKTGDAGCAQFYRGPDGLHRHVRQFLHLLQTGTAAAENECHHGQHDSKEQARTATCAACVKAHRGLLVKVCLHAHHRPSVLHPKVKTGMSYC